MLSPDFRPAHKLCSLDGKKYNDGEDVHVDGNHCICAVGSWVCTSPDTTSKDTNKKKFGLQDFSDTDDDYNDLDDDDYDLSSENNEDYVIDEDEDEEYLEELFDDLLDKLRKHRKQQQHHNRL
ncbi:hypothetical protein OTU49_007057 [Cherax quadricarinatus]